MAKMNARMKEIFEKQETVVLATATKKGAPNVVPITAKKLLDDETILVSDQFFNKTLANLKENPQASITIWDNLEGYEKNTGGKVLAIPHNGNLSNGIMFPVEVNPATGKALDGNYVRDRIK